MTGQLMILDIGTGFDNREDGCCNAPDLQTSGM
jgi:hypothetical protein